MDRTAVRSRALRRGVALATAGLVAATLGAAQARASAPADSAVAADCQAWRMATGIHYTSNHLLGVNLQSQRCPDHFNYKVVIHNYSINGVGNRAYGLDLNDSGCHPQDGWLWGPLYIPAHGSWISPPKLGGPSEYAAGVIYRPRTSSDAGFVPEVRTGCVQG